jgi:UDP-3-O-[3-hydroxymyristoyl] N-acetylglucosamine deacetylase
LIKGGSLENALVFDDDTVINGPLQFPDECARHKLLDVIGDLSLAGYRIKGAYNGVLPGKNCHSQR